MRMPIETLAPVQPPALSRAARRGGSLLLAMALPLLLSATCCRHTAGFEPGLADVCRTAQPAGWPTTTAPARGGLATPESVTHHAH